MPAQGNVHNGRCHCGQSEFHVTLKDEDKNHTLCHCNACKYLSGGENTLNIVVPSDHFKVTRGNLGKYTYLGDSGNPVHCYYCSNCTTHLYHHQTLAGDSYVVRSVLIDNSDNWPVAAEIFIKDKTKWQPIITDDEHAFKTTPPMGG
ncbi:hypothetical protein KEM55_006920 [Ascosphaera atra]|nr:hypothetical protein KEM55_006920 [Ascosphaera atra]